MLAIAGRRSQSINVQTVEMLINEAIEPSFNDLLRGFDQIGGGYRAKTHLPADNDNFAMSGEDFSSELQFE